MKTITTKGGQIFEIETLKGIIPYVMDCYINNKEWLDDDFSLYIEYKDGSFYYISGAEESGKFRKNGIKTIVESNPSTFILYGDFRIYNIDDVEMTYSEENDSEDITWNVE